jgi:hypothetical protein
MMSLEAAHERTRPFGFAPTLLARFFEMAVCPGLSQRAFTVELLFEPTEGLFYGFAFFQFNFGQLYSRSSLAQQTLPLQWRA